MFSAAAKVFLSLIRSTYNFTTYTFSLTLTAPGLDRVGQVWKIPPVKVFSPPFFLPTPSCFFSFDRGMSK